MFSIIIPTFNNLDYLKLCIKSIKKNSNFDHEIIPHVNVGTDGTLDFLNSQKINFTFTNYNSGICEGMNKASKKAKFDYILYSHDDFYFCPGWDQILKNEINKIGHNNFYLSGIMMNNGPIKFDCTSQSLRRRPSQAPPGRAAETADCRARSACTLGLGTTQYHVYPALYAIYRFSNVMKACRRSGNIYL